MWGRIWHTKKENTEAPSQENRPPLDSKRVRSLPSPPSQISSSEKVKGVEHDLQMSVRRHSCVLWVLCPSVADSFPILHSYETIPGGSRSGRDFRAGLSAGLHVEGLALSERVRQRPAFGLRQPEGEDSAGHGQHAAQHVRHGGVAGLGLRTQEHARCIPHTLWVFSFKKK